jgi:dTMP kinase
MTSANAQVVSDDDPAPDHDVRALMRITPFRRLWLALGLSSFGDWLGLLATAALAKNLASDSYSAQNFAIAGVFILRLAPAVLLGPLAGAVADRLDRRWTLVIGDLLRFALFVSIVVIGTLPWLFVATVLIECVALFWGPANDATVPNLVPRRRLEAANQLSLLATYGSAPIAAAIYAVLATAADGVSAVPSLPDLDPIRIALWVNAVTFLVSALVIWRLEFPAGPRRDLAREGGVVRIVLDGWRFVAATPVTRGLVIGMLGAFAAGGFVVGLAQTFVADLGAGQPGFGILFGAVFVGLAAGMWVGPRALGGVSRRRIFGLALVAGGGCLLLLALVPNMLLAVAFTVALGMCGGVAWVIGYTLLGLEVHDEVRGRTFAFLHSSARVVLVLVLAAGPVLAGVIGTHTLALPGGERLVYNGAAWVFGLAGLLAIALGLSAYRQMNDRPGPALRGEVIRLWNGLWNARADAPLTSGRGHNGWFIAFEGGDGTGKSTQARALADWLRSDQGHDVVLTREPGATAVGVRLREVLLGEGESVGPRAEALLFAADRAHHVDSLVRPALARGAIVITDRYVDSSIAYQGAGRALDAEEISYISRWATGSLVPDLTVLLDVPPEISRVRRANDLKRVGADRLEAQPEEFHQRVREGFLELARREPHRYLVLDGSDPRDQVQEAIRARIRNIVPISRKRRAELAARMAAEEDARRRRAAAEAEVLRLDAELRGRSRDEARARQEARRRAREEAERQLQEEAERQLQEEARRAEQARTEADREPRRLDPPDQGLREPSLFEPSQAVTEPIALPGDHPRTVPITMVGRGRLDPPPPPAAEPGGPSRSGDHALTVSSRAWFTAEQDPTWQLPPERESALPPESEQESEPEPPPGRQPQPAEDPPWLGETEPLPILSDPEGAGPRGSEREGSEASAPTAESEQTDDTGLREEIFGRWGRQ